MLLRCDMTAWHLSQRTRSPVCMLLGFFNWSNLIATTFVSALRHFLPICGEVSRRDCCSAAAADDWAPAQCLYQLNTHLKHITCPSLSSFVLSQKKRQFLTDGSTVWFSLPGRRLSTCETLFKQTACESYVLHCLAPKKRQSLNQLAIDDS